MQHRAAPDQGLVAGIQKADGDNLQPVNFERDRKSTRLNSSHGYISYAVFCLKKKKTLHSSTDVDVKGEAPLLTQRRLGGRNHVHTVTQLLRISTRSETTIILRAKDSRSHAPN